MSSAAIEAESGLSAPTLLQFSGAAGRWASLGPYYAMFPVGFALDIVESLCPPGGAVLDPFCGRGTVPYMARITGRTGVGVDVNPVGYLFASTKVDPEPDSTKLISRLATLADVVTPADRLPENEFQKLAWAPDVLGLLNVARRDLDWKRDRCDRTLMATILVHLHGKAGQSLSNQMRQSKSMAPGYAVAWWKARGLQPSELNPVSYLQGRINWRYKKGIPSGPTARIHLGDSRKVLLEEPAGKFDLLFTSPPYFNVTNYRLDNWIRLWMLGEGSLPDNESSQKFSNREGYLKLIFEVLSAAKTTLKDSGIIYIRTDSRQFTLDTTIDVVGRLWPEHNLFTKSELPVWSQTNLFGDQSPKPGETDLLIVPDDRPPLPGFLRH